MKLQSFLRITSLILLILLFTACSKYKVIVDPPFIPTPIPARPVCTLEYIPIEWLVNPEGTLALISIANAEYLKYNVDVIKDCMLMFQHYSTTLEGMIK